MQGIGFSIRFHLTYQLRCLLSRGKKGSRIRGFEGEAGKEKQILDPGCWILVKGKNNAKAEI
jgi:hypothetical protein